MPTSTPRPASSPPQPPSPSHLLTTSTSVTFGLNNALQVTNITDGTAPALNSERNVTDSTIRVTPAAILPKGTPVTYTFTYAGTPTTETSPVDGIKLLQIADPISVMLYAGRWFPMTEIFTDRFTSEIHVTLPKGETAVGSGSAGKPTDLPGPDGKVRSEFVFNWDKPGFPGTIVAGQFLAPITIPGVNNVKAYVTEKSKEKGHDLASTVTREFEFMTNLFGTAESGRLDIVELPADAVSAAWAPEVIAIRADRGNAPPPRQHRRPPVVGLHGLARHTQRRLDH